MISELKEIIISIYDFQTVTNVYIDDRYNDELTILVVKLRSTLVFDDEIANELHKKYPDYRIVFCEDGEVHIFNPIENSKEK